MLYKEKYEIDFKVGDIILYRNEFMPLKPMTWVSAAIRAFTKFPYNHAAIVSEIDGEFKIIEALAKGIVVRPLHLHLQRSKSKIMVISPKNEFVREEFQERLHKIIGYPYDYNFTVVAQGWWRLRLFFVKKDAKKQPKYTGHTEAHADKKFACAEAAAYSFKRPYWWFASAKELAEDTDFFYHKFVEYNLKN